MSTVALRPSSGWSYPVLPAGALAGALTVHETGPAGAPKPRLLDRVREATAFPTSLAVHGKVAASTQNQDVSTTIIYTHVLNRGPAGVQSPADRMFL